MRYLLPINMLLLFLVGCTTVGTFHSEVIPVDPVLHSRDLDFYDYNKISQLAFTVPGLNRFVDTLDDEVFDAKFGLPQDHVMLVLRKHVSKQIDDFQILDIEFGSNNVRRSFSTRQAMFLDYSDEKIKFLHFSVLSESSALIISELAHKWSKHSVKLYEFNRNTNTIDSYDYLTDETIRFFGKQHPFSRNTYLTFSGSEFRVFNISHPPESMEIPEQYLDGLLISAEWGVNSGEVCLVQINNNLELTVDFFDMSIKEHLRRLNIDISELLTGTSFFQGLASTAIQSFNTLMSPDGRYLCISHNSGLLGLVDIENQSFIAVVSDPQWKTDAFRHIFMPTDWSLDSSYVMLISESEVFIWDIIDFFEKNAIQEEENFSQEG